MQTAIALVYRLLKVRRFRRVLFVVDRFALGDQAARDFKLIGKVLNHSGQSTTAMYARFAQDQVRQALEQHGKQIMEVAR
ncbi:MAG TPA: hypothetical protein V6D08_01530 [Candidatus Obscuribacterales bacterium]